MLRFDVPVKMSSGCDELVKKDERSTELVVGSTKGKGIRDQQTAARRPLDYENCEIVYTC